MPIVYVNWDNYSGGINLVAHIKSLIHMLLDPTVSLLDIYHLSSNIPTIFFQLCARYYFMLYTGTKQFILHKLYETVCIVIEEMMKLSHSEVDCPSPYY